MVCDLKKEKKIGLKIEMEHSHWFPKAKGKEWAKKISSDHIKEYPCYYTAGLIPMEKKLKKMNK